MTTRYQKQQKKDKEEKERIGNLPIRIDRKSIIYLISFFCFLVIVLFVITIDIKGHLVQHSQNWTMATGHVLSVDEITWMTQTKAGNQMRTVGYKIKYYYMVDDVVYEQEYILGMGKWNTHKFINFVNPSDSIEVYYEKKSPKNSYINTNINSDFYKNTKN